MTPAMPVEDQLKIFKGELSAELGNILEYWMRYTPDEVYGGFAGRIGEDNKVVAEAPKGSVLNARILWSFSAAYNLTKNSEYLKFAKRAYQYIIDYFIDKEHGGVYWSVDYKGNPLDTKKQVYASAFTIYGLSEYYKASADNDSCNLAISLFNLLVEKSYDPLKTGYLEAFDREWKSIDDLRLSATDANEKRP